MPQRHECAWQVPQPHRNDTKLRHLSQDKRVDSGDFQPHRGSRRQLCDVSQRYDSARENRDSRSNNAELRYLPQDYRLDARFVQPCQRDTGIAKRALEEQAPMTVQRILEGEADPRSCGPGEDLSRLLWRIVDKFTELRMEDP